MAYLRNALLERAGAGGVLRSVSAGLLHSRANSTGTDTGTNTSTDSNNLHGGRSALWIIAILLGFSISITLIEIDRSRRY